VSNYPDGMSSADWSHINGPDEVLISGVTCTGCGLRIHADDEVDAQIWDHSDLVWWCPECNYVNHELDEDERP